MAKFMVLYSAEASASDVMANTSPDDMKDSMDEWIKWKDEAGKTFKVDFGLPLQAVSQITASGVSKSDNKTSGYSMVEGDSKDALDEILKNHPHLKTPGATIDVFEMLPIPGLDS